MAGGESRETFTQNSPRENVKTEELPMPQCSTLCPDLHSCLWRLLLLLWQAHTALETPPLPLARAGNRGGWPNLKLLSD